MPDYRRYAKLARMALGAYRHSKDTNERIAYCLEHLLAAGGVCIKFAQNIIAHKDFQNILSAEKQREIFDRVSVVDDVAITDKVYKQTIINSRGRLQEMGDGKNFAAGSFAVVYEAMYVPTRAKVVVKILRPGIIRKARADLRVCRLFLPVITSIKPDSAVILKSAFFDIKNMVMLETDYRREVVNAGILAHEYEGDDVVVIPKTYTELCTQTVIVQEYVTGLPLSEVTGNKLEGSQAEQYVKEKIGSSLTQQICSYQYKTLLKMMQGKFFHGDPHPGNILLQPGNKVALIDFGVIAEPLKCRLAFFLYLREQVRAKKGNFDAGQMMIEIIHFHANHLYRAIMSMSEKFNRGFIEELKNYLNAEFAPQAEAAQVHGLNWGRQTKILNETVNINNRFAIKPRLDTVSAQKAQIIMWITMDHLGLHELIVEVQQLAITEFERTQNLSEIADPPMSFDKAMTTVTEWLTDVAERDPVLYKKLSSLITAKQQPTVTPVL